MKDEDVGYIFFTQYVKPTAIEKVKKAAEAAKIDQKVVKDIRPWNAFKRAMGELTKRGIIAEGNKGLLRDKVEDNERLTFQFTAKFLEGNGIRYDTKTAELVSFAKDTSKIDCADAKIRGVAEQLFKDALTIYHSDDIHRIAERLCAGFRRITLRDGVYFIPKGKEATLEQLEKFYEGVDGSFWCRPVNHTQKDQKKLVRAIISDLKGSMEALRTELEQLREGKKGSNGITKRIAEGRRKELATMYRQYRELALAIKTSVNELFEAAGDSALTIIQASEDPTALIQAALGGKKVDPTALELAAIATEATLPAGLIKPAKLVMPAAGDDKTQDVLAAVSKRKAVMPVS